MPKPPKDIKPLLRYFVTLFKLHVTGTKDAADSVRVVPVLERATGESIYEFKMRYRSAWKTRRMAIEPLGEKVESKSRCYKVVYDDTLVIKIPPRPITDFTTYLNHIRREHVIVKRIQKTIPCVFPQITAILKKVPIIRLPSYVLPEDAEKEYIDLLSKNPDLQEFLKIGDGFVFFMTLSRFRFFNQVIEAIHHPVDHTRHEIVEKGPQAISDYLVFESLYGGNNDRVYFALHDLAESYDRKLEKAVNRKDAKYAIPDFQKQEWLFSRIAGMRPEIEDTDLPEPIIGEIDQITRKLVREKKSAVAEFRKIVYQVAKNKNFYSNRGRMKGLVTNILELLYRLKKRRVAIRDLKPDNMYVAAFLDGADHILANPDAYELGLIDMETALCFKPDKYGKIHQPLLAGTPSYATPSHIFGNKVLRALYKDELPRIFYLQDMQAVLVMIFKIVTGRSLFVNAARLMLEISHIKKKNMENFDALLKAYKNTSRRFWKTAENELSEKLKEYRHRLEDVDIELPAHLKKLLASEYRHECKRMGYPGDKKKEEEYRQTIDALNDPVSAYFLIGFMFRRVCSAMYRPEWDLKNGNS